MIYLLRHGETAFNAEGRYQGRRDSPLTARGRAQATAAGLALRDRLGDRAARIFCSPLGRACQTAAIVATMLAEPPEIRLDPRLTEIGMGAWDGLTRAEIEAGWPGFRKGLPRGEWMVRSPDGESYEDLVARLGPALRDVAAGGAREGAPAQVIVSHGVAGRVLRGLHAGLDRAATLAQDGPQDALFALAPGGGVERIAF